MSLSQLLILWGMGLLVSPAEMTCKAMFEGTRLAIQHREKVLDQAILRHGVPSILCAHLAKRSTFFVLALASVCAINVYMHTHRQIYTHRHTHRDF